MKAEEVGDYKSSERLFPVWETERSVIQKVGGGSDFRSDKGNYSTPYSK